MISLVYLELYKIFKKWRTYISFAAVIGFGLILQIVMVYEGDHYLEMITNGLENMFVLSGNFFNGYMVAYMILGALIVHVPFLVTLVTGDMFAGEATGGTYRLLLIRPVSRLKISTAKFIAGFIYTCAIIIALIAISLGLGLILFGRGELLIPYQGITVFAKNDILWRFACSYGYAIIAMMTVASLSMLFSTMVENSIGPIAGTMAVIIVFIILSSIDIGVLRSIRPYLFTTYTMKYQLFFANEIDFTEIWKSIAILVTHITVFTGSALFIIVKKDILS
ncbi:MAG: ABC transporter permease [Ignavibacteria bacterium]|nr:ABC transporter permease [Ignavibacteria bacterium]